jgi:DNA polymerase-3 subunit epsilon
MSRALDTLMIARQRYPGAPATLDALCRRFAIDNSSRTKHGALLDAELLAEVYLELSGGRQPALALAAAAAAAKGRVVVRREPRPPRPHAPSEAELAAHAAFVGKIKNAIWLTKDEDQAVA